LKVTVDIRRSDLFWLSLYLYPRLRSNWITLGVFTLCVAAFLFISKRPDTLTEIRFIVVASILGSIGGMLGMLAVSQALMLLGSKETNGILGEHHFELSPEGIRESTRANETLQRWLGVQSLIRSPSAIYVRVSAYQYHIVPRSGFDTDQAYDAFWQLANQYWAADA